MHNFFPEKIYVLQSPNKTYVGLRKHNKPYVVGFSNKDTARRVMKHVADVKILDNSLVDTVSLVEMRIIKSETPYDCNIKEMDINCFMNMPLKQNIGVVLGCEIIKDNSVEIGISSVIVDPLYDIKAYREFMAM